LESWPLLFEIKLLLRESYDSIYFLDEMFFLNSSSDKSTLLEEYYDAEDGFLESVLCCLLLDSLSLPYDELFSD